MKVWIARNKTLYTAKVSIYFDKPIYQAGIFISSSFITTFNVPDFEKIFQFRPHKGSCNLHNLWISVELYDHKEKT